MRRAPAVDLVVGPQSYHRLPELLARAARGGKASSTPSSRPRTSSTSSPRRAAPPSRKRGVSAFLTVQEGCDKFCTFCVVPYTRGAEVSRPVADDRRRGASGWPTPACARSRCSARTSTPITARARTARAWTLGAAAAPRSPRSPGIARLRYTTSHPRDMDDDLIAAHRDLPQLMPLPAPAGAVGLRPHPRRDEPPAHARRLSARSSSGCARRGPTSRLSSDFIVGFPGETDDDFARHAARWSTRSASPAPSRSSTRRGPARRPPTWTIRSPEAVKAERLQRLQAAIDRQPGAPSIARCVGTHASTCCSSKPGRHPGQLVGRSPYLQPVQVDGAGSADRRRSRR